MNQLSWLLYIGNVLGNLGSVFVFISLGFIILCIIAAIALCVQLETYSSYNNDPKPTLHKSVYLMIPAVFVCWLLAALCPSQDTVYAIAASQVGEQALKTPLAQKAEKAINVWLDNQISKQKGGDR